MPALRLGTPARHLDAVASTMTEAASWAAEGAPHGALIVAEHQTAGRGRHGRLWADVPGQSLMLSLVLRDLPAERVGLVPLAAGLAVADAVAAFGVDARLKWPNDVHADGRKLAGVLAEASWSGSVPVVILGVGLNVEQDAFPGDLSDRATSLHLVTGHPVDRLAPLAPLLRHLADRLAEATDAPARLVAGVESRLEGIGQPVSVAFPGADRPPLSGLALGLAADGALRLATDAGEVAVHAGEVTLSPALP